MTRCLRGPQPAVTSLARGGVQDGFVAGGERSQRKRRSEHPRTAGPQTGCRVDPSVEGEPPPAVSADEAGDVIVVDDAAPVAGKEASGGDGVQISERVDAVAPWPCRLGSVIAKPRSAAAAAFRGAQSSKLVSPRNLRAPVRLMVTVSRLVGGILSSGPLPGSGWVAIHLCGLPGDIGRASRPTLDLAPGGVCRAARVTPDAGALLPHRCTLTCDRPGAVHRRSVLCGTFLRVTSTGR
jgi:hypothetical protein